MTYTMSQIRLLVTDFPACFRFYRDTMGFEVGFGDENDIYADFHTKGVQLAIYKRDIMASDIENGGKPLTADAQDTVAVTFEVENVDAAVEALTTKGVTIVYPPTDRAEWGLRTAHFRDPSGNLLEVHQGFKQPPQ